MIHLLVAYSSGITWQTDTELRIIIAPLNLHQHNKKTALKHP